jgi:hypothetical protein
MIRRVAFTCAFLTALASPAVAQIHPTHPGMPAHDPSMHMGMDSATHAVLHALLMSAWHGTITTPHGTGAATMAIALDSLRQVHVSFTSDQHAMAGTATAFAMRGDTLQWIQDMGGTPCKATMVVSAALRSADPAALKGNIVCAEGDLAFALTKQTK